MAYKLRKMEQFIKDSGQMIKLMVMDDKSIQMVLYMKANSKTTKHVDMEFISKHKVLFTKVIG